LVVNREEEARRTASFKKLNLNELQQIAKRAIETVQLRNEKKATHRNNAIFSGHTLFLVMTRNPANGLPGLVIYHPEHRKEKPRQKNGD
jgi:hypothetical protein